MPADLQQAGDEQLQAQRSFVKIGERRAIVAEAASYEKHVKDVLSPNVSRIAAWTVWGNRAGIRMSLAADQDWDRALDEMQWLVQAAPMDTHHLLADIFARDLGTCWYSNGRVRDEKLLYEVYGHQLPVLMTVSEPGPAGGLLTGPPPHRSKDLLTQGLQPPDGQRTLKLEDEVYLGELKVLGWDEPSRGGAKWQLKLACPRNGLRVTFRTEVPPRYIDPDGIEENLIDQKFHVVGVVEQLAFDRLADILQECVKAYVPAADERVELGKDGKLLTIHAAKKAWPLPNPLLSLHRLLGLDLPYHRSIIHGDLHARNVIVSPRGMPYYIDFSETEIGPTLFDFVKHEVGLWDWNLADPPANAAKCSLLDSFELMEALTQSDTRFPASFVLPTFLQEKKRQRESEETNWLATFYQCIGTIRALAKQFSAAPDKAPDYFKPLCLYACLALRWYDPRDAGSAEQRAMLARRGVFLASLSGMLLKHGLTAD
jgi:hypothetical protein